MIPIVFATDKNMILQTGVTLTSLLLHSLPGTYHVYLLIDETVMEADRLMLLELELHYDVKISFIQIENQFDEAVIGESYWSKANLYRLLLPDLITEHDVVIYSDVDIIFRSEISHLVDSVADKLISGCVTLINKEHADKIGVKTSEYICAGFVVMNLKKMRDTNFVKQALALLPANYKYMDQDIINLLCKDQKVYLPTLMYGFDQSVYENISLNPDLYSNEAVMEGLRSGLIHYTGKDKPWKTACHRSEVWWWYYQRSIFFDPQFYYLTEHQIANGDNFTLNKRFRLFLRYFIGENGLLRK